MAPPLSKTGGQPPCNSEPAFIEQALYSYTMHNFLEYRTARPADIEECIEVRALTRQNAISATRLAELGITLDSWSEQVRDDSLYGMVCLSAGKIMGYCFGDKHSGEIVVLALLPEVEEKGIGKLLLGDVVAALVATGHSRLHLGCSADPTSRSYGFYRHLGWNTTNRFEPNGDEILELLVYKNGAV